MRRSRAAATAVVVATVVVATVCGASAKGAWTIESSDVAAGGRLASAQVNDAHGCAGQNVSPALHWSSPPAGTNSVAVTLYDTDARDGKGFWHWLAFDIPPGVEQVKAGASGAHGLPAGAQEGRNSFGAVGYGGACPPKGAAPHHYVLSVWAMGEARLPFAENTVDAEIGDYLRAHAIAHAQITATFSR